MKNYHYLTAVVLLTATLFSCKKGNVKPAGLASINIVNASINLGTVKANFTGKSGIFGTTAAQVAFGANTIYTISAGQSVPVSILSALDTLHAVYNQTINAQAGSGYSLYLAGQLGAVDALLLQDELPNHPLGDSVMGVRFINLSYNSNPVNVTVSTNPSVNQVSNLAYKQISDFIIYPAKSVNTSYQFQIFDAATNTLLASSTLSGTNIARFKNITLALKGMAGGSGSNALGIQRINNY